MLRALLTVRPRRVPLNNVVLRSSAVLTVIVTHVPPGWQELWGARGYELFSALLMSSIGYQCAAALQKNLMVSLVLRRMQSFRCRIAHS